MGHLKPCPFCGKTPQIIRPKKNNVYYVLSHKSVQCFLWLEVNFKSLETLKEAWNNRYE